MKKFSKISNYKINSDNVSSELINGDIDSKQNLRYSIHQLIEEFLKTSIYGPIDPILEGTIKIEGREEFIDALLEFMRRTDIKEQISLLESAKFNGLENTLINLNYKLIESQTPSERAKHQKRVRDLVAKSEGSLSKAKEESERQANRIETGEKAYYRSIAAENLIGEEGMDKKILKEISKIFLFRSQQLGYRK